MTTEITPTPRAGISAKVANPAGAGSALALITWALTYFIPAWHSGIPGALEPVVVAAAYGVAAFAAGYQSIHRATFAEIITALDAARKILAAEGEAVAQANAIGPALAKATTPGHRPVKDAPQA